MLVQSHNNKLERKKGERRRGGESKADKMEYRGKQRGGENIGEGGREKEWGMRQRGERERAREW